MSVAREEVSADAEMRVNASGATITVNLTEFDQRHYVQLIRARGETIRRVVSDLRQACEMASAVDAGCGVGFFSQILQ